MHLARQPKTPMEWQQENRERMYAAEERREWQARFDEAPAPDELQEPEQKTEPT